MWIPSGQDLVVLIVATCSPKFNLSRPDGRQLEPLADHAGGKKDHAAMRAAGMCWPGAIWPVRAQPALTLAGKARPGGT